MPNNTLDELNKNTPELSINADLENEYLKRVSSKRLLRGAPSLMPGEVKKITGGVDFEKVKETLGTDNVNVFDSDIQKRLGEEQGFGDKIGNFGVQVGAEVLGGTIEGIGYLGDVQGTAEVLSGDMTSFGNWLSDIGSSIKEGSRESFPIFGAEDMSNSGFWLSNGVSVASSLSLMVPAVGSIRGIGALGKAMGLASKFGKPAKAGMSVLGQAVASRHMENMMEASQNWTEVRDFALRNGKSLEEANIAASDAASNLYKVNYALLAQDILQYGLLARGPKINKEITSRKLAEALGKDPRIALGNMSYGTAKDMVSEGLEEGLQFVFAEETKNAALHRAGLVKDSELSDRLKSYSKNSELWTSMLFGFIGAGVMQGAGAALRKTDIPGIGGKAEREEIEARIQHAKESSESATQAAMQLQAALKSEDKSDIRQAEDKMAFNLGYDAAQMGNFDLAMANIDELINSNKEEATSEGNNFSEDYKERLKGVKSKMEIVADLYKQNAKKYNSASARGITEIQYNNIAFNEMLKDNKSEHSNLVNNFPRYNDLSAQGQNKFSVMSEKIGLERAIDNQRITELDGKNKSIKDQATARRNKFEKELVRINKVIDQINLQEQEDISAEKGDPNDINSSYKPTSLSDASTRVDKDNEILKGLKNNADAISKNISSRVMAETDINENNEALDQLTSKKGQAAIEEVQEQVMAEQKKAKKKKDEEFKAKKDEEKAAADVESVNESRENIKKKSSTKNKQALEDAEVSRQASEEDSKGKDIKAMSDEELDDIFQKANTQEVKEVINAERIRREQAKREPVLQAVDEKVVQGADIIEAISYDEPAIASNNDEHEQNDEEYSNTNIPFIAETGHAIAWKSTTGLNVAELAEDFEDIDNAKALTEFFEDPSVVKTNFKLEFYIDKDRLRASTDFKEGVEEELKSLYAKLQNKETLTKEEIGILPVRAYIIDSNGERVKKNDKDITTAVHDTTFGMWEQLPEDKRTKAINETIAIKEKVLSAAIEGKKLTSAIEEVRNGTLLTEKGGTVFEKNNLTMATGIDPADMTIVMGETAPKGSSSRYVSKPGDKIELYDGLDSYRSATPGAVYVVVKTANGSEFPIRTFVENLTAEESELVYKLYSKTLEDPSTYKQNLGKHSDITSYINKSQDPRVKELSSIANLQEITIADFLKLLVYEGLQTRNSGKGALFTNKNGSVRVGDTNLTKEIFLSPEGKKAFLEGLSDKRRQVSISNLNNPKYVSYLVNNNILTANATNVNGVMFVQPTTIFGSIETSSKKEKDLEESKPSQQTSEVKEGVSEVFAENSELSEIGNEKQYSEYLDTIFPDSKVKDIVYHISKSKFEEFDKRFQTDGMDVKLGEGFYFSDIKEVRKYADSVSLLFPGEKQEITEDDFGELPKLPEGVLYRALLDAKSLQQKTDIDVRDRVFDKNIGVDSFELTDNVRKSKEYVVFEPNQIHILGSKKDIQGFKDFVGKPSQSSEVKLEPSDRIVWGHPGLGKTTFKESNPDNVLDFDTDFKPEVAKILGLDKESQTSEGLNEWRIEENEEEFKVAMRKVWKKAVAESKKTGKMLVVSDMMFLKENESDFDKIVTTNKETFIDRTIKRGDNIEGLDSWKSNIDKTLSGLDSDKIIETDKYFSELIQPTQTSEVSLNKESSVTSVVSSWLQTEEGSLDNQTAEESASKFALIYNRKNPITKGDNRTVAQIIEGKKKLSKKEKLADAGQTGSDLFNTIAQGMEVRKTILNEIKDQVLSLEAPTQQTIKVENVRVAKKDKKDIEESSKANTVELSDFLKTSGSQKNKQGAVDTQNSIAASEMANTIDLSDLSLIGRKSSKKSKYGSIDFDSDTATKVRTATTEQTEPISQKEIDAISSMVPESVSTEVVEDYITLLDGGQAVVGMFQAGLIQLSRKAKSGDGYHEAFHAVFRSMLSPKKQQALLQEARDMFSPLDSDLNILMKRHNISKAKAEDLFYEEQLADEFGIYAVNPRAYDFNGKKERKSFFERLMSWVKDVLGITGNIEKVFKNIQEGKFNKAESVETLIQAGVINSINDKTGKPC